MSKFKVGDKCLFVAGDKLTPVRIINIITDNAQKYPVVALSNNDDYLFFTNEGRMNVTDILPRLYHLPSDLMTAPAPSSEVELPSLIVSEIINDLLQREERGLKKYGTTVDRGDLSLEQWMQHFYEELLDGAVYARKFLQDMRK